MQAKYCISANIQLFTVKETLEDAGAHQQDNLGKCNCVRSKQAQFEEKK